MTLELAQPRAEELLVVLVILELKVRMTRSGKSQ
jgi:hypothetical protein